MKKEIELEIEVAAIKQLVCEHDKMLKGNGNEGIYGKVKVMDVKVEQIQNDLSFIKKGIWTLLIGVALSAIVGLASIVFNIGSGGL